MNNCVKHGEDGMGGRYRCFGVLLTVVCCLGATSWGQGRDLTERILFNAKVFTGVPVQPYAEAVAIRGDKIISVGSLADTVKAAGKGAERVDLGGKTLLPGLVDSHIHAIDGGLALTSADVGDHLSSMDELASVVAEAKKSGKGMR